MNLLQRWFEIGVKDDLFPEEKHKIKLLNQVNLIMFAGLTLFFPFYIYAGIKILILLVILGYTISSITLLLTYYQKITVARFFFVIMATLFLIIVAIVFGREYQLEYCLLTCSLLPPLLFEDRKTQIFLFLYILLCFISLDICYDSIEPVEFNGKLPQIKLLSQVALASTFFATILFYKTRTNSYEQTLRDLLASIQQKNEALENANYRLSRSESELQAILDSTNDAFIYINRKNIIKAFNKLAATYIKEIRGGELLEGQSVLDYFSPQKNFIYTKEIKEALQGQIIKYREYTNSTHGIKKTFSISFFPVYGPHDGIIGALIKCKNITLKRQSEELLLNYNQELERFTYMVAHDFKEPLRAIDSYTTLLEKHLEGQVNPRGKNYFQMIHDNSKLMENLLKDFVIYSTLEEEKKKVELVDLNLTLLKVKKSLAEQIYHKEAIFIVDPLPELNVNPQHAYYLLHNLLSNALKFSDKVPVKIKITVEEGLDKYTIRFSDNGIGINANYFDKIFDIFQRLHTRKVYSGTGLGLALCRKIVRLWNGNIWVESTLGQGSTFIFTIPNIRQLQ